MTGQERQDIWRAFIFVAGCVAVCATIAHAGGCASKPPRPEDIEHTAHHQATLAKCMAEGRDAGSYAVFEACKRDGGITR